MTNVPLHDDDEGMEGLYLKLKLIIYDKYQQQILLFSKTGHDDEPNHRSIPS